MTQGAYRAEEEGVHEVTPSHVRHEATLGSHLGANRGLAREALGSRLEGNALGGITLLTAIIHQMTNSVLGEDKNQAFGPSITS